MTGPLEGIQQPPDERSTPDFRNGWQRGYDAARATFESRAFRVAAATEPHIAKCPHCGEELSVWPSPNRGAGLREAAEDVVLQASLDAAAAPTEPQVYERYEPGLTWDDKRGGFVEIVPPPDRGAGLRAAWLEARYDFPKTYTEAEATAWVAAMDRAALIDSEGLDVERLARAIRNVDEKHHGIDAITLAAEYARLTKHPEEPA